MADSSSEITSKQEAIQASVNGVHSRLDKVTELLSNAVIVENSEDLIHNGDAIIKLSKSDADILKNEVSKLNCIVKELLNEMNELNKFITTTIAKHDKDIHKHDNDIHKLNMKNNDLDQHYRLHNAIFHNMKLPPHLTSNKDSRQTSHPDDNAKFCKFIADQLNYYLPELSIPVSLYNIDIAHPLRNNSKGQPVVIVRFVNRHLRNEILEYKNQLKNFGVGVTEQLTPKNMELFNKTKVAVGAPNVWSRNGKLFARTDKGKVHITMDTVINELLPPPPREEKTDSEEVLKSKSSKQARGQKNFQQKRWGAIHTPPPNAYLGPPPGFMNPTAHLSHQPYGVVPSANFNNSTQPCHSGLGSY